MKLKIQIELEDLFYKIYLLLIKKDLKELFKYNIIEEYNIKKIYPSQLI